MKITITMSLTGINFMGLTMDITSCVLLGTGIIAGLALLYNASRICRSTSDSFSIHCLKCLWGKVMGTEKWDFTTNWVGPVGALLAFVLPFHKSTAFVSLGLFFGMLMLAAPIAYNASCKLKDRAVSDEPQYKVSVPAVLITSALSLWAILGGSVTALFLLYEMQVDSFLIFVVFFLIVMILAIYYNIRSTYRLVREKNRVQHQHSSQAQEVASTQSSEMWKSVLVVVSNENPDLIEGSLHTSTL